MMHPRVVLGLLGVLWVAIHSARADDWPQWLGPQRDGVWRETGIMEQFPAGGLKPRWRTPIGAGYAGPAVASGKVYVTDRTLPSSAILASSGFAKNVAEGKEGVICLDEATGKILWKHEYDCTYDVSYASGPRCTPVVSGGKVYTLGAMGDLLCLDADHGKVIWSKNFVRDYGARTPMWGFAGHPLVDGDKLICLAGAKDGLIIAYHKDTGKEIWRALSAREMGYCPPMIYQIGDKRQLIIWYPEGVAGLNPETGETYWIQPWRLHQSSMSISTPRYQDGLLFLTNFYNGSMMLKIEPDGKKVSILWKGKSWEKPGRGSEQPDQTEQLHSIISTPVLKDGYIYGVCSYGQLRCLEAATGKRLWETLVPTTGMLERWGNAFLIEHGDRFFLFNEKGDLIIAKLSPQGYDEISRVHLLEPTNKMASRPVVWMHPAFANKCIYARNDHEIVCYSLAK